MTYMQQVIRSFLEEMGGHEVCTEGDAFILAFHDAVDAVKWSVKVSTCVGCGSCELLDETNICLSVHLHHEGHVEFLAFVN
jgi:hypothetical protein